MKAIEINGEIKIYNQLPKSWGNIIGGFHLLSDDDLESYGFYEVVSPQNNSAIEELGELYLENNKYYYKVIQKTFNQTLAELKENKINNLQHYTNSELAKTDWYYIRKLNRNIDIPQEVEDQRVIILNNHNDHETAINALTKKADVVKYEFR